MEEKDSTAYECACETGYIGKDCDIGKWNKMFLW
jgi:hypothetical protein